MSNRRIISKNKWVVSLNITDTLQIEVRAETQVEAERIAVKKASKLSWSEYKEKLLRSTGFEVTETNLKNNNI